MSGSPLDPLVDLLTSLALTIGATALVTVSAVMFLRWLGLHWTWRLPGVLLGPLLWPFDHSAASFVVATSVFATATGTGFTERSADASAFFGEGTLRRLQTVKRAVDPGDEFCSNHPVAG
jgi:hypothetical protein